MNTGKKDMFKAELQAQKAIVAGLSSMASTLQTATYPVAGPMVTIPSLPVAANIIRSQNEAITKLMTMLERILDEL